MASEPVPSVGAPGGAEPPAKRSRRAARRATTAWRRFWHRVLQRIGWELPPMQMLPPVESRPWLGRVLSIEMEMRRLPPSYTRLFPFTPVENPDELVGREQEMAGLREAASRWKSGNPASVLITGIHGSGKTSLFNCGVKTFLSGEEVLRGEVQERWQEPDDMHAFLSRLLGLPPGADLLAGLQSRRRVILIEQIERGYLRIHGGFAALEEFLNLVQASSRSVFWVVTLGELPRRLLQATLHFARYFSHRINAGQATREMLTAAILQRHRPSGLRLVFMPSLQRQDRLHRIFEQTSPEDLFFEALHRQSEGVFRTGFELWLDSIESIDRDAVHLRLPTAPRYRLLRNQISIDDLYLLKANAQHGSLTAAEAARILALPELTCQRRLERLLDLQILERDSLEAGYRFRAQAVGFIRDLLDYHNMIE